MVCCCILSLWCCVQQDSQPLTLWSDRLPTGHQFHHDNRIMSALSTIRDAPSVYFEIQWKNKATLNARIVCVHYRLQQRLLKLIVTSVKLGVISESVRHQLLTNIRPTSQARPVNACTHSLLVITLTALMSYIFVVSVILIRIKRSLNNTISFCTINSRLVAIVGVFCTRCSLM